MRKIIFTTIVTLLISTGYTQTNEDSIKVKRNSIGFNLGGIYMTSFYQTPINGTLSLKYHRMLNKRIFRVSLNNRIQEHNIIHSYDFNDDSIPVNRTSQTIDKYYNARFGLSKIHSWGFGNLILSFDIILGYSKKKLNSSESEQIINNGVPEGIGIIGQTEITDQFINAGIDFSIAYEIDLSNRLVLSLEYIPELISYSSINTDSNSSSSWYLDHVDAFALNIFCRF